MKEKEEIERLKRQIARLSSTVENQEHLIEGYKKEVHETKNRANFWQFNKDDSVQESVAKMIMANKFAVVVFLLLARKMNKSNAIIMSQETLVNITGKSRSTVSRAISDLKKHKYIDVIKVGTANAYVINSEILWGGKAQQRHAVFSATVVASLSEQSKEYQNYVENWDGVHVKSIPAAEFTALAKKSKSEHDTESFQAAVEQAQKDLEDLK